jgi:hypothetical protein
VTLESSEVQLPRAPLEAPRDLRPLFTHSLNQLVHLVINPVYMEAFFSPYPAAENVSSDDHKTADCQWSRPECPTDGPEYCDHIFPEAQEEVDTKFFDDDKSTADCQWPPPVSECPSPIDCSPEEGDRIVPGTQEKVIKVMNRETKFFYDDVIFRVRPFKYQKKMKIILSQGRGNTLQSASLAIRAKFGSIPRHVRNAYTGRRTVRWFE